MVLWNNTFTFAADHINNHEVSWLTDQRFVRGNGCSS
jgi:hypothetical protein